ncbi:hypothetical protein K439DRAFT_1633759 [Ramaria rubella]|nr:hypothetical protein K439DRAFT_1633759 [Ramaria rubella]
MGTWVLSRFPHIPLFSLSVRLITAYKYFYHPGPQVIVCDNQFFPSTCITIPARSHLPVCDGMVELLISNSSIHLNNSSIYTTTTHRPDLEWSEIVSTVPS